MELSIVQVKRINDCGKSAMLAVRDLQMKCLFSLICTIISDTVGSLSTFTPGDRCDDQVGGSVSFIESDELSTDYGMV
jgi:hypothetical protein